MPKFFYPLQAEKVEIGSKSSLFGVSAADATFYSPAAKKPGFRHAGVDMRDAAGVNREVCAPERCTIAKIIRYVPESDGYGPSVIILKSEDKPTRYHFLAHLDRKSEHWDEIYVGMKVSPLAEDKEKYIGIIGEYDPQMNHVHWEVRPAISWQGQKDAAGNYLTSATKWITCYSPLHLVNKGLLVRGDQLTDPIRMREYLGSFKAFPHIEDNSFSTKFDAVQLDNRGRWSGAMVPDPGQTAPGTPSGPADDRATVTTESGGGSGGGISIFALAIVGIGAYFLLKKRP